MKHVEAESFGKSFLLFFLSLSLLSTLLFYAQYKKEENALDERLFTQMKLCSFNLQCNEFQIDFVPLDQAELFSLLKNEQELYTLFSIPDSQQFALKIMLAQDEYAKLLKDQEIKLLWQYGVVILVIILLSVLFSFYALHPLREALKLTEEFIKDILHDFNTPLASLRLNTRMLNCPQSEQKKIDRIELGIETILSLQNNLRSYQNQHQLHSDRFDAKDVVLERMAIMEKLYPALSFRFEGSAQSVHMNRDAFGRIVDNLLSNAAKYNTKRGSVTVKLENGGLEIKDTGIGIAHPEKAFERFYKEHERGIGIGLHSVKKLCDAMNIKIKLSSEIGTGTTVVLDLKALTLD